MTHRSPLVLLIEDESSIAETVTYALRTEGIRAVWLETGQAGIVAVEDLHPDLVILDVGLPDGSGFDVYRKIQAIAPVPVIFLTARSEEVDRVVGLEMGADDYVVKPFSPRELTARVRAILRRTSSVAPGDEAGDSGDEIFQIDKERMVICYCGQPLTLSRYEYRLLKVLIERPGRVYTREQLLQLVWDAPEHRLDRTVDTHVKTIRAKLRQVKHETNPIKTHRGTGYSLDTSPNISPRRT